MQNPFPDPLECPHKAPTENRRNSKGFGNSLQATCNNKSEPVCQRLPSLDEKTRLLYGRAGANKRVAEARVYHFSQGAMAAASPPNRGPRTP
jgi:hypothetical protein